jgi:hypothetical protein
MENSLKKERKELGVYNNKPSWRGVAKGLKT